MGRANFLTDFFIPLPHRWKVTVDADVQLVVAPGRQIENVEPAELLVDDGVRPGVGSGNSEGKAASTEMRNSLLKRDALARSERNRMLLPSGAQLTATSMPG